MDELFITVLSGGTNGAVFAYFGQVQETLVEEGL